MDATKVLSTGEGVYTLDSSLASAPEPCPHCKSEIPLGEQFCLRCGYQRGTWGGDVVAKVNAPSSPSLFELVATDGSRYALVEGETIAGRGDVALRVEDGYISRSHARFYVNTEKVLVVDLGSSNGTFVEGERIDPHVEHEVSVGGKVALGQREFELVRCEQTEAGDIEATQVMATPSTEENETQPDAVPCLTPAQVDIKPAPSPWVLTREGQPEYYLPYGDTVLGRKAEKVDMVVRGDGYVSGQHCKMVASEDTLEIIDLGSTNGTYVNSERCEPSQVYTLEDGYALRLGKTDLAVMRQEEGTVTSTELAEPMPIAEDGKIETLEDEVKLENAPKE